MSGMWDYEHKVRETSMKANGKRVYTKTANGASWLALQDHPYNTNIKPTLDPKNKFSFNEGATRRMNPLLEAVILSRGQRKPADDGVIDLCSKMATQPWFAHSVVGYLGMDYWTLLVARMDFEDIRGDLCKEVTTQFSISDA